MLVVADLHLLTGNTDLSYDRVLHCTILGRKSQNAIQICRLVGHYEIHDLVGEGYETLVGSNEVGLTLQGDDSCEIAIGTCNNSTLRSLTGLTLGGNSLTLLANLLHCLLHVTIGNLKGLLAILHTGTSDLAEFLNLSN